MTIVDKAGRVRIPKFIREQAGFHPGTPIEISVSELGIALHRVVQGPEIVEENGLRFARPRVARENLPPIDLDQLLAALNSSL